MFTTVLLSNFLCTFNAFSLIVTHISHDSVNKIHFRCVLLDLGNNCRDRIVLSIDTELPM